MSVNNSIYREKAIEAINQLYSSEYLNSLGIPLPEIEFLLPDSANYKSGEYYIYIGDTWQIHLNLGSLPTSYKKFQEEIRVLVRHEIEHYMCCPYDVLTHLRMINAIILTYKTNYSRLNIDIGSIASSLSNQVADIIVDTKNFKRNRTETVKSEISWIKKSCSKPFAEFPRHAKLMFLTKESLWGETLGLENQDEYLNNVVNELVVKFNKGGITNQDLFVNKTILFANSYFEVYQKDQLTDPEFNKSESESKASQQFNGNPNIIPAKNAQGGTQFIFQSPDKIQEALDQLAQEMSIEQFSDTLAAAGFKSMNEQDKQKIWFNANNEDVIPIIEQIQKGSPSSYSFPATWKIGDQLEEIDMMLSFSISPKIIPGITTKKWVKNSDYNYGSDNQNADLLLVIDTSDSMGSIRDPKNNLHQAILASYGILKYFEHTSSSVALIGFSDKITTSVGWTKDYEKVREKLLIDGSGGTTFPISNIQTVISNNRSSILTVIITDGEISNFTNTIEYFTQYLLDRNKLYLFLQSNQIMESNYKKLKDYGAKVARCLTANEMREMVLNDLS